MSATSVQPFLSLKLPIEYSLKYTRGSQSIFGMFVSRYVKKTWKSYEEEKFCGSEFGGKHLTLYYDA
ncbi:hypothetical protein N0V90_001852 [Kalmusia sp. IMI 367209]|nr:hypothetical protein N0V90_001852 [Kalmusia sp. IMI 367209]